MHRYIPFTTPTYNHLHTNFQGYQPNQEFLIVIYYYDVSVLE